MGNETTPIELLMAALSDDIVVDTVLIPEQCARIYFTNGKCYHVTIEEIDMDTPADGNVGTLESGCGG